MLGGILVPLETHPNVDNMYPKRKHEEKRREIGKGRETEIGGNKMEEGRDKEEGKGGNKEGRGR